MHTRDINQHTYSENRTLARLCMAVCTAALCCLSAMAQQAEYPQNYFRSPINIALAPSGTFAEVRSNHFHSGIDFRIGGVVGQEVFAVADGYVSRIKVSAYGGGKTLYITHPNGYKSVYMHLNNFCGAVADYVYQQHYLKLLYIPTAKFFPALTHTQAPDA